MNDVTAAATAPGTGLVRLDLAGTVAFVVVAIVGVASESARSAVVVASLVLFTIGVAAFIWSFFIAAERSRELEIGVANLYLLTGATAPPKVKLLMSVLLGTQVVVAFAGAIIGAVGLTGSQVNALAFGILVPMFPLAMNSLWAVRHGAYGPRIDKSVRPTNKKIG